MASLPARELLPGDIVELQAGDRVPADIRVAKLITATIRAEQASLTGESVAVGKRSEQVSVSKLACFRVQGSLATAQSRQIQVRHTLAWGVDFKEIL